MPLTTIQSGIVGNSQAISGAAFNVGVPIVENTAIMSNSYCITTGSNAHSIGPITVSVGATVVVPVGSVWTII
jgi:hypothetical protein